VLPDPIHSSERATLYRGDALHLLPDLPPATVDLVLVDPPYNSGGRTAADRTTRSAVDKYVSGDAQVAQDLADFAGDTRDQRSYAYWLTLLLSGSLRASAAGASCLVFSDWRQLAATSDALQAAGWSWRGVIAWHKPIHRPRQGGFAASCEYVLWGANGPVDARRNPVYLPGLYSSSQPRGRRRQHITQKPLDLLQDLVKVCIPGGVVLDPCAGSGSTGVAALNEGRRFIGMEITEHYSQVAAERLAATVPGEVV
jgi:site-specific DNA-methyltransferase (adenine-specific)